MTLPLLLQALGNAASPALPDHLQFGKTAQGKKIQGAIFPENAKHKLVRSVDLYSLRVNRWLRHYFYFISTGMTSRREAAARVEANQFFERQISTFLGLVELFAADTAPEVADQQPDVDTFPRLLILCPAANRLLGGMITLDRVLWRYEVAARRIGQVSVFDEKQFNDIVVPLTEIVLFLKGRSNKSAAELATDAGLA